MCILPSVISKSMISSFHKFQHITAFYERINYFLRISRFSSCNCISNDWQAAQFDWEKSSQINFSFFFPFFFFFHLFSREIYIQKFLTGTRGKEKEIPKYCSILRKDRLLNYHLFHKNSTTISIHYLICDAARTKWDIWKEIEQNLAPSRLDTRIGYLWLFIGDRRLCNRAYLSNVRVIVRISCRCRWTVVVSRFLFLPLSSPLPFSLSTFLIVKIAFVRFPLAFL